MKERNNPYTTRYEESTGSIGREAEHSRKVASERHDAQRRRIIGRRQGVVALGLIAAAITLPNMIGGGDHEGNTSNKTPSKAGVESTR